MLLQFRIEGVDCANCAMKIENAIAKLPGVQAARLAFMSGKLTVEGDALDEATLVSAVQKADRHAKLTRI